MGEMDCEVEKIIGKKIVRGEAKYLLKWVGFSPKYNSWEPAGNLNCPELMEDFENRNAIAFYGKCKSHTYT